MRQNVPAWILLPLYLIAALFFPSPLHHTLGLLAAIVLFLSATTVGRQIRILRRAIHLRTNESTSLSQVRKSTGPFDFPLGLGLILLAVFAIGTINASPFVINAVWIVLAVLSLGSIQELNRRIPLYTLWALPFLILTIWSTFTPTTFYDALAYNLGIPYQYLAYGRISTFPTWTTSFFPPFDQITKFLILSIGPQNGVKIFSILIFFHVLRMLSSSRPESLHEKYIVLPLLLLPVPWILIHIVNPDMLNSFFFIASICALLQKKIVLSAVLLAFCCWTKYTIYPYVIFFPVLLWPLSQNVRAYTKNFALFFLLFLTVMSPLYIRNIYLKGDPLYPLLNSVFTSDWKTEQTAAVQKEFPTPRSAKEFAKRVLLTPFLATFRLRSYGSASEIGILPLLGLLLILFQIRKLNLWLTIFTGLCYLIWIYQLYHFRYFLPVYFVAMLLLGFSFQWLGAVTGRLLPLIWAAGTIWALYVSAPPYKLFPPISPKQNRDEYLSRLSYYSTAQVLNQNRTAEKTIMVGETRNAYIRARLVPFSYTDPDPLLRWSQSVENADELYAKLKQESVGYILYNPTEMNRLAKQYGIWKVSQQDNQKVRDLLQKHGKILFSKNGVLLIRVE